jgi:opacity protein-like surface antigen
MSKLIWGSSVNKVLLIAVSVVGLIGTSGAEAKMAPKMPSPVMAPPAHSSWSGPYLGAGLDFMMGSTSVNDTGVVTETGAATNGALVRLLGGYNWQLDDLWVAGIEGSVAFGNVHGNVCAAVTQPSTGTPALC